MIQSQTIHCKNNKATLTMWLGENPTVYITRQNLDLLEELPSSRGNVSLLFGNNVHYITSSWMIFSQESYFYVDFSKSDIDLVRKCLVNTHTLRKWILQLMLLLDILSVTVNKGVIYSTLRLKYTLKNCTVRGRVRNIPRTHLWVNIIICFFF